MLEAFNFDRERCNEWSALILLALLDLSPDRRWAEATNPLIGFTPIMDWLREEYHKDYKPNTRESVRRKTLHQFAEVALALQNPDEPDRPVNPPKWCYQVSPQALYVMRAYGTPHFTFRLQDYLTEVPGLKAEYDCQPPRIRDH